MLIRFDAMKDELKLVRESEQDRWESHLREHAIVAEMIKKTETQLNSRLEDMNSLRTQITSERGMYITRDAVDERMAAVNSKIDERGGSAGTAIQSVQTQLAQRIEAMERANANLQGRLWALGVGLTIVMFLSHYIWKS